METRVRVDPRDPTDKLEFLDTLEPWERLVLRERQEDQDLKEPQDQQV